jgi:hypothetical protein
MDIMTVVLAFCVCLLWWDRKKTLKELDATRDSAAMAWRRVDRADRTVWTTHQDNIHQ